MNFLATAIIVWVPVLVGIAIGYLAPLLTARIVASRLAGVRAQG